MSPVAVFGSGRRLTSSQNSTDVIDSVGRVLDVHSPAPYAAMGALHRAQVEWRGDGPRPVATFTCTYGADEIFVLTMANDGPGTLIGLFPLGNDLTTPLVGQWKQADGSLSSVGTFAPGTVALRPPTLASSYFEDMLRAAGFDTRKENALQLCEQVLSMFNVKAYQFITSAEPWAAESFISQHRWTGDLDACDRLLADLGNWNRSVIPYIQDLPDRVRGLLLERDSTGSLTADIWQRVARPASPPSTPISSSQASNAVGDPVDVRARCGNEKCSNFGQVLDQRQCPVCFHYAQTA
jgi:hypothetical protein